MPYGYNGKILHVDLTSKKTWIDEKDEVFYRTYMGGGCLGGYYLMKETKPGIDPLGPENVMVFAASVLTGAPLPGFSRHCVTTKSPLTNAYLDTEAGGFWGPELKFSGFDAVVVKGKSETPVYIYINDGNVEIKDASKSWGKIAGEAQDIIKEEIGEDRARMLVIGPAGENLVKYASIVNENKHMNGRGGSGAVMGSKNLKAIVCRGTKKINMFDKEEVQSQAKWFANNFMDNAAERIFHDYGTAGHLDPGAAARELPTKNFSTGYIENAENLGGESVNKSILEKREGCYACAVRCKGVVKGGKYDIDPTYGGPEYETLSALGSNCGITDVEAVGKAHELCNKYTLDSISTGGTIAFAMECFEKGIIDEKDTDGLELKFGNAEAMLKSIEKIAYRSGKLGELLAEGTKRMSEIIGKGSDHFALHCKGMELAMHDPRAKGTVGLGYACSPLGGDHVVVEHDNDFDEFAPEYFMEMAKPLGILRRLNARSLAPEKIRNYIYLQNHFSFHDCLCICVFVTAPCRAISMKRLIEMMDAITGWENSLWEIMKVGERRVNIGKAFNVREGYGRKDDKLPGKMFETLKKFDREDITKDKQEFEDAIDLMYEMAGWDKNGKPLKAKLHELDLGWVIEHIYE